MKKIYLCWVDDIAGFVASYDGKIQLLQLDHECEFVVDEHLNTDNFDTIAKALTDDSDLIFLVDYNLKGNDGKGMEGDEVIKLIRAHNSNCIIVFYSSKASQQELRELVAGLPNVVVALRESIQEILTDIANGEILGKVGNG